MYGQICPSRGVQTMETYVLPAAKGLTKKVAELMEKKKLIIKRISNGFPQKGGTTKLQIPSKLTQYSNYRGQGVQ